MHNFQRITNSGIETSSTATGLIIWDFDGTIADSLQIFIAATNRLAKDFGYQPISSSQIAMLRTLSLREMVRTQLKVPTWKLLFFLRRFRQELTQMTVDLQLIAGMKEALLEIHQQNYRLGIVTSNSRQNVENFLHLQGISHLFEFIYGGQVLSGKGKVLKSLLKLNRRKSEKIIFVGDETSDIKAAKQVGLANIAVSWGFNNREVLAASDPDMLIDRPKELLRAIARLVG
jgi:phosphoglycolate phosphatase